MPSNVARYSFVFILIHWVLVLTSFILLGLGWYITYIYFRNPKRGAFY
jgi:Ni,Fe-hydrogenase I cytochrome b subunit